MMGCRLDCNSSLRRCNSCCVVVVGIGVVVVVVSVGVSEYEYPVDTNDFGCLMGVVGNNRE